MRATTGLAPMTEPQNCRPALTIVSDVLDEAETPPKTTKPPQVRGLLKIAGGTRTPDLTIMRPVQGGPNEPENSGNACKDGRSAGERLRLDLDG